MKTRNDDKLHKLEQLSKAGLKRRMNALQIKFVNSYFANNMNAVIAHREAGYKGNSSTGGWKILRSPLVSAYINIKRKEMENTFKITREKMLKSLSERADLVDEMCRLANQMEITDEEVARLERLKDILKASDGNKAWAQIAKTLGWDEAEKHTVEHKGLVLNYIDPTKVKEKKI